MSAESAIPLAFYAPLKAPDHPAPSGDRTVARLLVTALGRAGFAVETASRLRAFEPLGEAARQAAIREAARAEADAIAAAFLARPWAERPRIWFTYHSYYKAPDWIGPRVAARLAIPYVLAEATRAGKRAGGPWALAHQGSEAALDAAALVLAVTQRDRFALDRDRLPGQTIADLPPFLNAEGWPAAQQREAAPGPARLLAVAMMREGDKLASYAELAAALAQLRPGSWVLDVVGDGPARSAVAALLAPFGEAVRLHGAIEDRPALASFYAAADLLVWPAVNEAYGMALLEAQVMSCPIVAGRHGGVADALVDGETGLLAPPGDPAGLASCIETLLADPTRRLAMGEAASRFVRGERGLAGAATRLRAAITPLLAANRAAA